MSDGKLIPADSQHNLILGRQPEKRQHTMDQVLRAFFAPFAPSSRDTIEKCLAKAAQTMGFAGLPLAEVPWHHVDATVVSELIARWRDTLAKPTLKLYIFAVRGVARSCYTHHLISSDQYDMIKEVRMPSLDDSDIRGQYVKDEWLDALIGSCVKDKPAVIDIRDHAMLALLFGAGLRRNEAVNLLREDLDLEGGRFKVVVKGGKKALRFLAEWAVPPIVNWLNEIDQQAELWNMAQAKNEQSESGKNIKPQSRKKIRQVRQDGRILRRLSKSGTILDDLEGNGLYNALKARCLTAGTPFTRPHDARRTLATDLINEHGLNIAKKALGHKNITTTQLYDMTDDDQMSSIMSERKRES